MLISSPLSSPPLFLALRPYFLFYTSSTIFQMCPWAALTHQANINLTLSLPLPTFLELVFCLSSELNQQKEGRRAV